MSSMQHNKSRLIDINIKEEVMSLQNIIVEKNRVRKLSLVGIL
jgi:hypothetical protein